MSIKADLLRGNTETIILANLIEHESYGYEINKSIQDKTGGKYEFKEATLYTAFRRLEEAGSITSFWGDETTGARRRYYKITQKGIEDFRNACAEWYETKELIDLLIGTEGNKV